MSSDRSTERKPGGPLRRVGGALLAWSTLLGLALALPSPAGAADKEIQHDERARKVPYDDSIFGPDPSYEDKPYDPQAQVDIYGAKYLNRTQRPLLELGRRLYDYGAFRPPPTLLGETNPMAPQLLIFGDARTTVAYNDNSGSRQNDFSGGDQAQGVWANTINLDVDLRLTATERFHLFWAPIQHNGKFSGCQFLDDDGGDCEGHWEEEPLAYFFEGDLGAIVGGAMGVEPPFDLPIAGGLTPLLFQNGIWVLDAFQAAAFTVQARNSRTLDISNFDITFFAGFDEVTTEITRVPGRNDNNADASHARIYGFNGFFEATKGYWEGGAAWIEDRNNNGLDSASVSLSFTRRYENWFSNSVRVYGNFGQDPDDGLKQTANGVMLLIENSLITSRPGNVIPYFNFFFAYDTPQPLASVNGFLTNTGLAFETDGLTGFPFLDDKGQDSYGGALGLEILQTNFKWQIVGELAFTRRWRRDDQKIANQNAYAASLRFQYPLTNALIFRADAIYAYIEENPGRNYNAGFRTELRYKF